MQYSKIIINKTQLFGFENPLSFQELRGIENVPRNSPAQSRHSKQANQTHAARADLQPRRRSVELG